MSIQDKIDKYLNERKDGSRSPKDLADNLTGRLERVISKEIAAWEKETFEIEGTDYNTHLFEVLSITAKRMKTVFEGLKKGDQKGIKHMRK